MDAVRPPPAARPGRRRLVPLLALAASCSGPLPAEWQRRLAHGGERLAYEAEATGGAAAPDEAYYGQRASLTEAFAWHLAGDGNICVVTHHTPGYDVFADVSTRNHAEYARLHDYPYSRYRGRLSGAELCNLEAAAPAIRYGLSWQKLVAVQRTLDGRHQAGPRRCRWVMWVDSDVLFTRLDRRLEELLRPYESTDVNPYGLDKAVVLAREEVGAAPCPINAGVFFVKNSAAGRAFVDDILAMYPVYRHGGRFEQDAVRDWALQLSYSPVDFAAPWGQVAGGLRPEVGIARQRLFNSFYGPHLDPDSDGYWRDGDFIAHLVGGGDVRRLALMEELLRGLARPAGQEAASAVGPHAGQ